MIILLNGPPRSGKDTIAKFIKKKVSSCLEYKMSQPLKSCFRQMFQLDYEMTNLLLEKYKDDPIYSTGPMTPRQFQIDLSEEFMKPKFGKEIFGTLAVNAMKQLICKHIVISDSGFEIEIPPLMKHYGRNKLLGLHLQRPDCSYDNDSRSYIDFERMGIEWATLDNKHDLELLEIQVERLLKKWKLIDE